MDWSGKTAESFSTVAASGWGYKPCKLVILQSPMRVSTLDLIESTESLHVFHQAGMVVQAMRRNVVNIAAS
jgi:adenosylcobinamide amidohydrolase